MYMYIYLYIYICVCVCVCVFVLDEDYTRMWLSIDLLVLLFLDFCFFAPPRFFQEVEEEATGSNLGRIGANQFRPDGE